MKNTKRYFSHKIENILVIQRIVTLGYFEFEKDFATEGETHDFWEMVYADKESIVCTAEAEQIALNEGEILFHKPNQFHALSANRRTAPNVLVVSFVCRSEAMRFFEDKKLIVPKAYRTMLYSMVEEGKKTFDIPFPDPYAKKIELRSAPTLGGLQLIKNTLEMFLINLMRSLTETEDGNRIFLPKEELENKAVSDLLQFLSAHVCARVTVEELCRRTGYSRAYLFREFKRVTGKSVMEYFNHLKITRAKQLLRERRMSVREISEYLSFDTPNYFSKTFRRIAGMTPTAYQKRTRTR